MDIKAKLYKIGSFFSYANTVETMNMQNRIESLLLVWMNVSFYIVCWHKARTLIRLRQMRTLIRARLSYDMCITRRIRSACVLVQANQRLSVRSVDNT